MQHRRATRRHRLGIAGGLVLALAVLAACGGGSPGDPGPPTPNPNPQPPPGPVTDVIVEDFLDASMFHAAASNADWGAGEASVLRNVPSTSRHAYVYAYPLTNDGVGSGRGQYFELTEPLTGADLAVTAPQPPVSMGRRVQWAVSDTAVGDAGWITSIAWGPARNQTVAASYPRVRLRLGFQTPGSTSLGNSMSGNCSPAATLVYDGPYTVAPSLGVGNTPGHPTTPHVAGYAQGLGCTGGGGTHNEPLFGFTGWYPWPALTTPFAWDPGDPGVADDRRLVVDASVEAGDFTQRMRAWFAVTYPCSGILIAGWPETSLASVFEGDLPVPPEQFTAGILNPAPATVDLRLTLTDVVSVAQSTFYASPFGDRTIYDPPILSPAVQTGDAVVALQFQGADAVGPGGDSIDMTRSYTGWTSNVGDLNGMRYVRFRILLTPDPLGGGPARVDSLRFPVTQAP